MQQHNTNSVTQVMTNVFGSFRMSDSFELSAIWLKDQIGLPDGRRTKRIKPGDEVVLVNGELVDAPIKCEGTHLILGCFGTLANTDFKMICIDKNTNEPITVQL